MCFGLELLLIVIWRALLVLRNKRRDKMMVDMGISEEERARRGREMGEQDCTDFENIYVSTAGLGCE